MNAVITTTKSGKSWISYEKDTNYDCAIETSLY